MYETYTADKEYRMPTTSEEILGIFLKDPLLLRDFKRKLRPEMFKNYAPLFAKMLELDETESFTFKDIIFFFPQQAVRIHEMMNSVAGSARLPYLIDKLKEEYLREQIRSVVLNTDHELITMGRNPNEVLQEAQEKMQTLMNTESTDLYDPSADVDAYYKWVDEIIADPSKAIGLLTGLEDIDYVTNGFFRTDFVVVGARTSIGKSAFIIELALRFAKKGYSVALYSLEMTKPQIYNRMLANLMHFDAKLIRAGRIPPERRKEMEKHKDFLKSIYIDDTRGVSADYITDSMRRLKRTRGLDIVIVDYIQDVKEPGEQNDNGGSAIARICRKLRKGAQEFDCVVFGLSQVTRSVEERRDKRPLASDLAGSTGIETSADVIAMLYRDDYYDPNTDKKDIMEVNFVKQRNGQIGKVELYYAKKYQQLRPLSARY